MSRKSKNDKKTSANTTPELGRKKTWVFRIIALVVLPVLLFGGLEAGLRLIGFGYPTKALIERDFDGKRMCFRNTQFAWRFFPHQMARDFDAGLAFEKKKGPRTFRIFVLGGSAARGTPEPMFNFGRSLEAMLGAMYPDIHFEVHNAAIVAINSHVVLEIAKDCAKYDPDLFIVYLGNNEVVGPFGPGTVLTDTPPSLSLIRANIAFKSTRMGQLCETLIRPGSSRGPASRKWEGMSMFLDKQVRPDSPALETAYHHFKKNLQDIYRVARRSGADVIISNVGANLRDCPPFASLHREGISDSDIQKWEDIYHEGIELEAQELYGKAIERYLAAANLDDAYAELHFRLGNCYWEAGDYEKARRHYLLARQDDTLRFRADEQINNIIRTTAEGGSHDGIHFADSVAAFEESSPHHIPGSELFYEHVHLTFKGNYVLARTLFPLVQKRLPATAKPQGEMLSEEQVAHRIAYTAFDEHKDLNTIYHDFLNKPPFTNQLNHDESMQKMKAEVERLGNQIDLEQCLQQYDEAISENPSDWRLLAMQFQVLIRAQVIHDPKTLDMKLRKIITLHPFGPAYNYLGHSLLQQRRWNESKEVYNKLLLMDPASGLAHFSLADLSLKRADRTRAIQHFLQGIKVAPTLSIQPYGVLAELYDREGKTGKAIQTLQKSIEIFPENQTIAQVHFHLAKLLYKQDRGEEAVEHMETALRIAPDFAKNKEFMIQYNLIRGN